MAFTRYNWKPDVPDFRDHKAKLTAKRNPSKVDLRGLCSRVEDQGSLGSCTGQAIVGALEFLEIKNSVSSIIPTDLSRLYVYYQERVVEGTINSDEGAMIRTGVKVCNKVGICAEKLWPYKVRKFKTAPPATADADAATRKISEYLRITDLTGVKNSLAAGYPVIFGFAVYDSFESDKVATTGMVPMPTTKEKMLGGHAVLAVGYDNKSKMLIVRNSWGPNWADDGYFYLPYGFVTSRDLSDDFWTIRK
jgi:C1A family cysteine protease